MITIPILTNYRTYLIYHSQSTYNLKRVRARKRWLHQFYTQKFVHNLHHIDDYRIAKGNNIPVDYIMRAYRKQMRMAKAKRREEQRRNRHKKFKMGERRLGF